MGLFSKLLKPITNLIGEVLGFLTGTDFDDQQEASGVLVNKQSNIEPIPIIYGRRKVGGVRAFISTGGGKKNEYLYIALILSEGEIDAIEEIYINDTLHTDEKYSGLVAVDTTKLGSNDQAYSTLLSGADSSWGANHRLRGVAYLAIRLKYDQDVFGSIPDIQCVVRGRKVYDPRNSQTAYSTNPALCLRDYLTNSRYGKGLSASVIDDSSFISAANTLDTLVTSYSGGGQQKLIECNAVIDTGKKLFDNVKILLQNMRGLMPYSNGIYSLLIDKDEPSTFSLNSSNITSDIDVSSIGKDKKYNKVTVKYVNPEANWQDDAAIYPEAGSAEETQFLAEDNGEELAREVTMNTVTNPYSARDLARLICLASRNNSLTTTITATSEALAIAVGDVVTLEHPSLGWDNGAEKQFRVLSMQLMDRGDVRLTLQEYTASIYPWVTGAEAVASPDTSLPDPFVVQPPTLLNVVETSTIQDDGTVVPALLATWTAADDAFVTSYEVVVDDSSRITSQSFLTSRTEMTIIVRLGGNYTVRVRSINSLGARSIFISFDLGGLDGDQTPPAIPTELFAYGGYKQNIISWVNPTATDFKHVEIHASSTSGGTYNLIGVSSGDEFVHPINGFGITQYYKVRAFDFSGNDSEFSNVASATTEFVDSDAFTDEVTQLFSNANVKQIENYSSLPLTGDYIGQVIFLTSNNKLYRWTGSSWTASVPTSDLTGQITGVQISDDSISAEKIATNAVTADAILAGTITGEKITADTITGGLLQASGIITKSAQIDDGLITNAKIGNAAITTAKIANLQVSTVKIDNNAVTVPNGVSGPISVTLNSNDYQYIGGCQIAWTNDDNKVKAITAVGFVQVTAGTGVQNCEVEIRRVYWDGNYDGVVASQSFNQNGGNVGIGAYFLTGATAQPYVNIQLWAKVNVGTQPAVRYSLLASGAKK